MSVQVFKKLIPVILAVALLLPVPAMLASCGGSRLYSEGDGELNVVCTNFPPFDFAREIGGVKVKVTVLQDNGADLHNYSPTSAAIMAIKNADVFIYVGGSSDEAWLDSALTSAGNPDLIKVAFTEHCTLLEEETLEGMQHTHDRDEHEDHEHGEECEHEHDEHVWLSLRNAKTIASAIANAFVKADSENTAYYRENEGKYLAQLDELDKLYTETFANASRNQLLFADRFPFLYLANDYGLECYAAFSGCSTEVNASFETTQFLIDKTKELGLTSVLIIDADPKNAPAVAGTVSSATGAKILSLNSCQSITRASIKEGVTYLGIMRDNLAVLKEALN